MAFSMRCGIKIGRVISSSNQMFKSRALLPVGYLRSYTNLTPMTYREGHLVKQSKILSPFTNCTRFLTSGSKEDEKPLPDCCRKEEKLGLIARFKKMYKEYWYVLVPVHLATSAVWFGSFYYASKSGVDIILLLQSIGFSETATNPLKDSSMGHVAISYLLYKIATPARYTVTLGGTTVSIKYLSKWGYIKPMPTRDEFYEMYNIKRENLQEKIADTKLEIQEKIADKKQELRDKKTQLQEKKQNIIKTMTKKKEAVEK